MPFVNELATDLEFSNVLYCALSKSKFHTLQEAEGLNKSDKSIFQSVEPLKKFAVSSTVASDKLKVQPGIVQLCLQSNLTWQLDNSDWDVENIYSADSTFKVQDALHSWSFSTAKSKPKRKTAPTQDQQATKKRKQ